MTFIIFGVGAIGGTIGARLAAAGHPVTGIARGAQLEAIREKGLTLRTPAGAETVRFPCVAGPADIDFAPDDIVLLTMKSQDTLPALEALAGAGVENQAIVCAQNGVENERQALRLFDNVYGMLLMLPATYVQPGEVAAFGAPKFGILDIGRFPHGVGPAAGILADALNAAGFAAFTRDDVMKQKYGKLLLNLGNIIDAALVPDADAGPWRQKARAEAEAALSAAGIEWSDVGAADPRRDRLLRDAPVAGAERVGSSSTQSLVRGAGSIETDYLNGEIVLMGRLHGTPTPVNTMLCRLARLMLDGKFAPRSVTPADMERLVVPG